MKDKYLASYNVTTTGMPTDDVVNVHKSTQQAAFRGLIMHIEAECNFSVFCLGNGEHMLLKR
jgi:hypothetical protein